MACKAWYKAWPHNTDGVKDVIQAKAPLVGATLLEHTAIAKVDDCTNPRVPRYRTMHHIANAGVQPSSDSAVGCRAC